MIARPVIAGLLAAGCLSAAAGGSYFAVRHNADVSTVATVPAPVPAAVAAPAVAAPQVAPVTETETILERPAPVAPPPVAPRPAPQPRRTLPSERGTERAVPARPAQVAAATANRVPEQTVEARRVPETSRADDQPAVEPVGAPPARIDPAERSEASRLPTAPEFEQIVIPAASVIGLEVETPVTSERARVEDRVDARVTRDVYAEGRLAIPAGSRVVGAVTLVERGGKVKERARLGVRFHTLVTADGRQVDLRTETIYREGDPPSTESSRKIGGAAIGGAVLGAIMGGKKGAIAGGAAGAAGGAAAVMAGGRNAAILPEGTIVTARVSNPVSIDVQRR